MKMHIANEVVIIRLPKFSISAFWYAGGSASAANTPCITPALSVIITPFSVMFILSFASAVIMVPFIPP